MTVGEVIAFADAVEPNAYSGAVKATWVNECEGMVQLEVFLTEPEALRFHRWQDTLAADISFPDGGSLRLREPLDLMPGGTVLLSGLTDYPGNNGGDARTIRALREEGRLLVFDADSFSDTGDAPDAAALAYDGGGEALLAPPPFDRLYRLYLLAMIHFANGEYSRYQNSMALFNAAMGDFARWYARVYAPADAAREA